MANVFVELNIDKIVFSNGKRTLKLLTCLSDLPAYQTEINKYGITVIINSYTENKNDYGITVNI